MQKRTRIRDQQGRRLKTCITSLYSYPLFNPSCISPFGGSEVRISLIAKELAKYPDLDVSLVVFDHGQPRPEIRCGVAIYAWPGKYCPIKADDPEAWVGRQSVRDSMPQNCATQTCGEEHTEIRKDAARSLWLPIRLLLKSRLPGHIIPLFKRMRHTLRRILSACHRWLQLPQGGERIFGHVNSHAIYRDEVSIYDRIDADVYIMHGNNNMTAHLAYYCSRRKKKYIMITGSVHDILAADARNDSQMDMYGSAASLMRYSIEMADLIIVQNREQAALAKTCFQRDTIVIANPIDTEERFAKDRNAEKILWVGKSDDRIKQPDIFIDIVQRMPEYQFLMIMNIAIDSVHRHILQRGMHLVNLKILTYVPFDQIEKYYSQAKLFVNTSVFEGFPNTFLQAAKYGVPIVSLHVDPNGMLSEHGCGRVSGGNPGRLMDDISLLMKQHDAYASASASCKEYVAMHHDKNALVRKYREAIWSVY